MDIPSISAIIAAAGVLIGVVLTVLEVRNLVETKETDLVISIDRKLVYQRFQGVPRSFSL